MTVTEMSWKSYFSRATIIIGDFPKHVRLKINSKLGYKETFPIKLKMTPHNKPEKTHEKTTE